MFVCWSSKGGCGTSVVAASLALLTARSQHSLLVDLDGDLPGVLGLAEPSGPGVGDWLASPVADTTALLGLTVPVTDRLELLPVGCPVDRPAAVRWSALAAALAQADQEVVVDAGLGNPPDALLGHGARSLLVIRPCYLAIRRAATLTARVDGVVMVVEPGRALGRRDVEHAIGAPVVAEVPYDPQVSRSVDSGLMSSRLPWSLRHALRIPA
jgi:MinD-like ATPase involved in chromosome partitioning or flagellar assembly